MGNEIIKSLKKNRAYNVNGEPAYFLGIIDGINTFSLEVYQQLYCFYFVKNEVTSLEEIQQRKVEIYTEKQLPSSITEIEFKTLELDEKVFFKFVLTAETAFPNSAFCPQNKLGEWFDKKGFFYEHKKDIILNKKYRAVYPNYSLIKDGFAYRQVDMRENYPDLILVFKQFSVNEFLETSEFNDFEKIYLRAKSVESYGGNHKKFFEWESKVKDSYENYFAGFDFALFKRKFVLKKDKVSYFENILKIKLNEIWVLK